jgi:ribosomal protein S20
MINRLSLKKHSVIEMRKKYRNDLVELRLKLKRQRFIKTCFELSNQQEFLKDILKDCFPLYSEIDRAARKKQLHKNKARRIKIRLKVKLDKLMKSSDHKNLEN